MTELLRRIAQLIEQNESIQFSAISSKKCWTVSKYGKRAVATVGGCTVMVDRPFY